MNELQTYAALRASGMDLVAQCHELSMSASLATATTANSTTTPPNSTSENTRATNAGLSTTSHTKNSREH